MNITAFLTYTFLTAYTPGPNNIMAMTIAGREGLWGAMPFIRGICAGFFLVMLACAGFSSALYGLIPSAKPVMLCFGAGYLLFLAWSVWQDTPGKKGNRMETSFWAGMTLQFVNVKIILYGITALSSYVLPRYQGIRTAVLFSFLLTAIAISGNVCWAAFGAALEKLFTRKRKLMNLIMAILLIYCAVSLFLL